MDLSYARSYTVVTYKTQSSGILCLTLRENLTQYREGCVEIIYTKLGIDLVIHIDVRIFDNFGELTLQCYSIVCWDTDMLNLL